VSSGGDESASRKLERDEEEEEERKQKELDDALLAACEKGSLNDVKKALTNGGSINAVNSFGRNGLSLACEREDWNVAAQIVKFLLSKRFLPSVCDSWMQRCAFCFQVLVCGSDEAAARKARNTCEHSFTAQVDTTGLALRAIVLMMKQCELRACCWTTEQTSNKFAVITITLRFCLLVRKVEQIWCRCCWSEAQT
jgi:hypothetical protein